MNSCDVAEVEYAPITAISYTGFRNELLLIKNELLWGNLSCFILTIQNSVNHLHQTLCVFHLY